MCNPRMLNDLPSTCESLLASTSLRWLLKNAVLVHKPLANSFSYLLTLVDCFIRWPEAIHLPDFAAPIMVKASTGRWLAILGLPSTTTTDRGAQFESYLFQFPLFFFNLYLQPHDRLSPGCLRDGLAVSPPADVHPSRPGQPG
ncbi:unnamed protein product [Schistocephalus solidus]|uniref:Integrase catalytic domain-containing protein n=1 Tax=Schistocephalus solidus TaxID=70667 RepID=A0A183SST2_SCHSO|nr:unnamed protein product [Schistocephalus solidus]